MRVEWLAAQTRFWNNVSWQINLFGSFCTKFAIKAVEMSQVEFLLQLLGSITKQATFKERKFVDKILHVK
jgi:hypothetical protein